MPRRPRPNTRGARHKSRSHPNEHPSNSSKLAGLGVKPYIPAPLAEDDYVDDLTLEEAQEHSNIASDLASDTEVSDNDQDDVDAPRVAQWVDEEDLEDPEAEWSDEDEGRASTSGPSELKTLQNDLSSLPLGALRRAQHVLMAAKAVSDSEDDSASDDDSEAELEGPTLKGKEKGKLEWSIKPRPDIAKRSNKHAPTEVTSKRPVTRRRTVVEAKTLQPRDPRFLPAAGEFSAEKFQHQYGFLADSHQKELMTLRDTLKYARKLLASSPRDLLTERQWEVERLELAVKRAESLVNKDRRDRVEHEALRKVTRAEKDKRSEGKGSWWMKDADKRDLLVRARYDALAMSGGKRAVKKAIDKRQKKIGQKEKKSRPFAKGTQEGGVPPRKRALDSGEGRGFSKRRKVS